MISEDTRIKECLKFARSMIGVKWRHRGRKPWAVDCLGLIVLSLESVGYSVCDKSNYSREPWNDGLRKALHGHFGDPVSDMKPGDIFLMQWPNSGGPCHVGFIADYIHGGLSVIHSYSMQSVIEHRLDEKWKSLIVEVYRPWLS